MKMEYKPTDHNFRDPWWFNVRLRNRHIHENLFEVMSNEMVWSNPTIERIKIRVKDEGDV